MTEAGAAAWRVTVEPSYGLKQKEVVWLCHQGSSGSGTLTWERGGWEGRLVDVSCSCVCKESNVFFPLRFGVGEIDEDCRE